MTEKNKDLEAILEIALAKAPEFGIRPESFESCYRASIEELNKRKASDVSELYSSLQLDAFYIESFQMGRKRKGRHQETDKGADDWEKIYGSVNKRFGTSLNDGHRGRGRSYVWLEKDISGKGILYCYGVCHEDSVRRANSHYFVVVGDFGNLIKVVDSFKENPHNTAKFVKAALGWKNETTTGYFNGEPDLFAKMRELNLYTPTIGQKTIEVNK